MTVAVFASATGGRVQVSVSSSTTVALPLKVWRIHPDGSRHRVLTQGQAVLIGGWVGFDYHAPFNQPVTYTAEAGLLLSTVSSPVWVISRQDWIVHPSGSALSMPVQFVGPPADASSDESSQRFQVLNRKLPVHRSSRPRSGEVSSLTVLAESSKEIAGLKALFADGGPLLLKTTWSDDMGWMWVQPKSLSRAVMGRASSTVREFTFGYEETTQPVALQAPVWTYADLQAAYPGAYSVLEAAFPDYSQLELRAPA